MSVLFVVTLGLPVLYLTGSLKKIVGYTGVGKPAFLLFFAGIAALSFLPAVRVVKEIKIDPAGAFLSLSPAAYLAAKKRFSYRYYLAVVLTAFFAVSLSFISDAYSLPFLPHLIGAVIAFSSALFFYSGGPLFAPVLTGVYGAAAGLMRLFSGMENSVVFFGDTDLTALSMVLCLFVSYAARPRGKHCARREYAAPNKR